MYKNRVVLVKDYLSYFRSPAGISPRAENKDLWDEAGQEGVSHNAGAWAKFGRPEKRLRFSRAAEFGRARMASQGPQGPQRFLR